MGFCGGSRGVGKALGIFAASKWEMAPLFHLLSVKTVDFCQLEAPNTSLLKIKTPVAQLKDKFIFLKANLCDLQRFLTRHC